MIRFLKNKEYAERKKLIGKLADENDLFFFYEGHNHISQTFSVVVKIFIYEYNWKIVPLSMDGIILESFPHSIIDNGISKKMGVRFLPALYIVSKIDTTFVPIAFGFNTLDRLERNICAQYQKKDKP